jgi:hypothetical protein
MAIPLSLHPEQDPVEFLFSRVRAASQHRAPSCLDATRTILIDVTGSVAKQSLAEAATRGDPSRLNIGDSATMQEWDMFGEMNDDLVGLQRQVRCTQPIQ